MAATIITALVAALAAAGGSFFVNFYIERQKRLIELRARAYEDFITGFVRAMALPPDAPAEVRDAVMASLLHAKTRAALFGGGAVVDALARAPKAPTMAHYAAIIGAMRDDLVSGADDRKDGSTVLRAIAGEQDEERGLAKHQDR